MGQGWQVKNLKPEPAPPSFFFLFPFPSKQIIPFILSSSRHPVNTLSRSSCLHPVIPFFLFPQTKHPVHPVETLSRLKSFSLYRNLL